jgi:hypothetical protein
LSEEGIKHEFSVPYTPQQNGVVERKNRTLIEAARTVLDEYKTLDNFWEEAINTACHAINRLYLHKIYKKTAYKLLTGNKPKVDYFRVFGCKCFILNKKVKSSKFAPRVDEGFLLGYASNAHGYRVFNNATSLVKIAVDVIFNESNGSQGHMSSDIAGNENSPCEAIKKLTIGEVKPQEKGDDEGRIWMTNGVIDGGAKVVGDNSSTQANPSTSSHPSLKKFFYHKICQPLSKMCKTNFLVKNLLNKRKVMIKFKDILWCLTLECTRAFKEIILWTTSLVASGEG